MKSIETGIAIVGMSAIVGTRSQYESHPGNLSTKDATAKSGSGNTRLNPVPTEVSFSTYGSRNERIAVVVKNKNTGEVIREIPSKELQKLHVHLDMLA
jgi:uncharacterized FlaG/YvyC family protein